MEKTTSAKPLVSVIILNYNTFQLTLDCVASIKKHTPLNVSVEYIIVDNASANNEGVALENTFQNQDDCKVLRSQINLGFGAGNVLGSQQAKGHYFAFINSDVLFTEDCFSEMVAFMKSHTDAGVCGIQILDGDGRKTISHRPFEGVRYKLFGRKFLYRTDARIIKINADLKMPTQVDFVIGSFIFFSAKAYRECGGFDPNIFLYYEEFDLCYRLKKLGYKTFFLPQLNYVHLEGKSGGINRLMEKEHLLSYLYVVRKNLGFFKFWIIKNFLLFTYIYKAPFKPKYRPLLKFLLFRGESLSHSLRHQQKQLERD
ncbi:glycosyltransferase family 2 protein [Aequorivita antarctica]|uniref:glycosyltransferase family 2 protein n=1 Tax=Aequorivita antarctica TaxID=153266 RepID=UPI000DBC1D14|nr:glycosyltransferase family 2 protein [Aequorivita antarctica]SRX75588.1 Putative glycosyltransferase EpsH [Aequorivita antarctica]